jgi:hypothetical protein
MQVEKTITVNLGDYQSLKIGVSDAPSFEEADKILISELERLEITASDKIRKALHWQQTGIDAWM